MIKNKKGAALMQVLLLTVVLAGIATVLLRVSLSRTLTAHRIQRTVSSQQLIEACMAEVNALWAAKTPKAFQRDLTDSSGPVMYCTGTADDDKCKTGRVTSYTCSDIQDADGNVYKVVASISKVSGQVKIEYTISEVNGGADLL